jgi:hypothetical protein
MHDARVTGERVLAGLSKGRRRAIERRQTYSRFLESLVLEAANRDRGPKRGKAKRVACLLRGAVSESGTRKILSRLYSQVDSIANNVPQSTDETRST